MALFDDGRFKGHSLTNHSTRLSKVEEVDQAVVRPTHEVVGALSKCVNPTTRDTFVSRWCQRLHDSFSKYWGYIYLNDEKLSWLAASCSGYLWVETQTAKRTGWH